MTHHGLNSSHERSSTGCRCSPIRSSATSRTWRVVNEASRNALDQPVGYKLVPTVSTPTMLASPASSVGRRAGFARHNLWVTPYRADERRAAGEFPNQHEGGDGLPRWTTADRSLVDTDVVLWYTFGVTHFVRPEDWPVMPVEYTGFVQDGGPGLHECGSPCFEGGRCRRPGSRYARWGRALRQGGRAGPGDPAAHASCYRTRASR